MEGSFRGVRSESPKRRHTGVPKDADRRSFDPGSRHRSCQDLSANGRRAFRRPFGGASSGGDHPRQRPKVPGDDGGRGRPSGPSRSLRIKEWIQARHRSSSRENSTYVTAEESLEGGQPPARLLENIGEESDKGDRGRKQKKPRRRTGALTTRRRSEWRSNVRRNAVIALVMATSSSSSSDDDSSMNAGVEGRLLGAAAERHVAALRSLLPQGVLGLLEEGRASEAISLALEGPSRAPLDACLLWGCLRGSGALVRAALEAGADADARTEEEASEGGVGGGETALLHAVRSRSIRCVEALVEGGATVNPTLLYGETPLHAAASEGAADVVGALLEAGADVRASMGPSRMSPLHLAAQEGSREAAERLLRAGADPNRRNARGRTPLHLAAKAQSADAVQALLGGGSDPNARDGGGRTPLHSGIFKGSGSHECLRLLLEAGADANAADESGHTPLHMAALHDSSSCVLLFLHYGGDVAASTRGGASALGLIVRRTPAVLAHVQEGLDAAISFTDQDRRERDAQVQMDFRVLVPGDGHGLECRMLSCFVREGQKPLLKHPLCETLLFLKWLRVRPFFLFNLAFYFLLVAMLTAYIMAVFPPSSSCGSHRNGTSEAAGCRREGGEAPLSSLLYLIWAAAGALALKEGLQAVDAPRTYLSSWDNVLVWPVVALAVTITASAHARGATRAWEHHLAAVAVLLAWVELLLLVGRFPAFGVYVQMFAHVTRDFGRFLLAYLSLLNAFSLSFGVLFPDRDPFRTYALRLVKTLVMMTGEVDYDEWFFDRERPVLYPGTSHAVFGVFLIAVTVILMNLLVGLAVSDIQGLQKSAGLDRLVRQAELLAHFEAFVFSEWLARALPGALLRLLRRRVLLCPSLYGRTLVLGPEGRGEALGLPRELLEAALRTARAGDRASGRRDAFANFRTLSAAAQFSRDADSDVQRSIDAMRFGLDLLVWDVDDRREARARDREAIEELKEAVARFGSRLEAIEEATKPRRSCRGIRGLKRSSSFLDSCRFSDQLRASNPTLTTQL